MLLKTRHIILVDDDEDECLLFEDALLELGYQAQFLYFRNGQETIDYLESTPDITSYLIFLDLNMPAMSGKDCLRVLRKHTKLKAIPVAIYSTTSDQGDIEETHTLGANVYIKKPVHFTGIKHTLNTMLTINWDMYLGNYVLPSI